jgi:hypothetical protein
MHLTQHRRYSRALILTTVLSLGLAASAVPQIATRAVASLALATGAPPAALASALAPPAEHPRERYAGRDEQGVPRYIERAFSDDERRLLREQFGIEEPGRLYLSDTLPSASLTYDTDWDRGERHLVGSYRVGAPSVRLPGESWEALERRLARTRPASFPAATYRADRSLQALDPAVRPGFERLLRAARRAGFRVRVTESRRSAERQAYLLTLAGHMTHTATSRHADGFALDVVVDDGNLRSRVTRRHWIAFRRWVLATRSTEFRLIGAPDRSWDWPHIESVEGPPAFRSVEELLTAARGCADAGLADCTSSWPRTAAYAPVALAVAGTREVVED